MGAVCGAAPAGKGFRSLRSLMADTTRLARVASWEDPMSRSDESDPLLAEQIAYYRAIAPGR
jgi:hypothetical protein